MRTGDAKCDGCDSCDRAAAAAAASASGDVKSNEVLLQALKAAVTFFAADAFVVAAAAAHTHRALSTILPNSPDVHEPPYVEYVSRIGSLKASFRSPNVFVQPHILSDSDGNAVREVASVDRTRMHKNKRFCCLDVLPMHSGFPLPRRTGSDHSFDRNAKLSHTVHRRDEESRLQSCCLKYRRGVTEAQNRRLTSRESVLCDRSSAFLAPRGSSVVAWTNKP